jgi:cytoskeletal protein RodZ
MPRLRAPRLSRFAAGAAASFVAVFGVLALRLHDGEDPALAPTSTATTTTQSVTPSSPSSDSSAATPSDDGSAATPSDDSSSGAVTATPPATSSAS